jgi:hypothetical protein
MKLTEQVWVSPRIESAVDGETRLWAVDDLPEGQAAHVYKSPSGQSPYWVDWTVYGLRRPLNGTFLTRDAALEGLRQEQELLSAAYDFVF